MIEFAIFVEEGHRRYRAWVIGSRKETQEVAPTRAGAVSKLVENHLDNSEEADGWDNMGGNR